MDADTRCGREYFFHLMILEKKQKGEYCFLRVLFRAVNSSIKSNL